MSTRVNLIVEGGQTKANASLAQPLSPLGVNIQEIVTGINEKTANFKGMKVPVDIEVEDDKSYTIEVGSPSISELIKTELKIDKGSGEPNKNKIANMGIEQVIKVAKMKQDSMLVNNLKSAVKSVIGSCNSAGILVEGKNSIETGKDIDSGKFDKEINEEITEVSQEKAATLQKQLKSIQQEIKKEMEKELAEKEAEEAEKKKIEEATAAEAAEGEESTEEGEEGEEPAEGEEGAESKAEGEEAPPKEESKE
ncbi:MAG: 50S ribosomal protein L11 [Nanoarchaeota archaeon]|nr:50S ribosomal protein L11 [Nanoarchaeota archaeon]